MLRSRVSPSDPVRCVSDWLVRWAREAPDRTFLAERAASEWRRVSYGEALAAVRAIAQSLVDAGLGPTKPLAILSGNSIDHALLMLAAMHVGVPVAPVSPAYSVMSQDHAKLRVLVDILAPGAVWAEGPAFDRALAAIGISALRAGSGRRRAMSIGRSHRSTPDTDREDSLHVGLDRHAEGRRQHAAHAVREPGGDRRGVAVPRGSPAGDRRLAAVEPHLRRQPQLQHGALARRHALHRRGQASARRIRRPRSRTCATSRRRSTSTCPRGFDMLVGHLEPDRVLRETFFRDLDLIFYAAAALSPADVGAARGGRAATRGAPSRCSRRGARPRRRRWSTQVHFPIDRAGVIGLPAPGCELAFVPSADKLEMRVRGPNVTPGYWRAGGGVEPAPRRRAGFYRDGRRRAARRSRGARARRRLRRAHRRELQARDRAPGSTSASCASR